ncbi:MAG TPA: hypothetical protein DCY02_10840 [Armatimonadetes bacterium]|nr:hypothetical protein [Armatimonadota bacterium]HCM74083.1 hypothetical protein [Armatimonadota bacterium]HRD31476.1 DUF5677 domain-containing protein [Fimbriimonadaceae bacterium]
MKMLEASQLGCLDAVRAVSMIGRPSAAQALIRTMFETFLNILILSIDGQINASEVTAEGCTENEQNDSLAKRFIGHAHHSLLCNMERFEEIWGSEVAEGDEEPLNESDVQLLRTLGEDARKQFGFGTYDFYWYPFKSIWAIKNYLWPKNGTPTFDTQAVPISNSAWDHYFELCYTFAGHYNHGGPASVLTHFQDGPNRTWKPVCLDDALDLADYSLATIAVALNCYDIYRSELKARGLVDIS